MSEQNSRGQSVTERREKLSLAERRKALVLACEYDRLKIRLVCAEDAAVRRLSKLRGASVAKEFFQRFPVTDLVRFGLFMLPKKQRGVLLAVAAARRLFRKRVV